MRMENNSQNDYYSAFWKYFSSQEKWRIPHSRIITLAWNRYSPLRAETTAGLMLENKCGIVWKIKQDDIWRFFGCSIHRKQRRRSTPDGVYINKKWFSAQLVDFRNFRFQNNFEDSYKIKELMLSDFCEY